MSRPSRVSVDGFCQVNPNVSQLTRVAISLAADTTDADGTVCYFVVSSGSTGGVGGFPLSTAATTITSSLGPNNDEGRAIYRNNATGRSLIVDFHLHGNTCETVGDVITSG